MRIVGRRDSATDRRVPTIAFKVDGRDSAEIVRSTEADRIGIRFGDFHSRRLIEHLGLADQVMASCASPWCTTTRPRRSTG